MLQTQKASFPLIEKASGQTISYELISSLICLELEKKPQGFIEEFCEGEKPYVQAVKDFLKDSEFSRNTASLVCTLLVDLGYKVKMTVVFSYDQDMEYMEEEATYYFIVHSSSEQQGSLDYQIHTAI
jgi:hypothetical protein